ncbi:hypothetical protein NLI96_g3174 [Meripilus lineatus]|uniref:Major facilitator superfamily (MFS) profile domain-containing protein n=1 Tax=Meripilus lineatus TaxID=2056292 RepID=A0AAD5V9B6_9APHY|nr:hypothetical protein NLI96_g3174 [Physisporinus lineatus]
MNLFTETNTRNSADKPHPEGQDKGVLILDGIPRDLPLSLLIRSRDGETRFILARPHFAEWTSQTAVSTILPTIVSSLHGRDFVWVSSAYSLASTCLIPASGGLAEVLGRRPVMLSAIGLFALGSALCGSAQNMTWLIAGRAIQGAGGGAIYSLSSIIIGDFVPLRERGTYQSTTGMVWTIAASIGPMVGGSLATKGQWRWLFYLNLPISGVAAGLVLIFLTLRTPTGTLREKLSRMDWVGNAIITGSSASCMIALTWGGIQFPWTSAHVLIPLVIGCVGITFFMVYEYISAKDPIEHGHPSPALTHAPLDFLPAYFQACFAASPIRSGVLALSLCASIGPSVVIAGASIGLTKKYRPQLWIGWVLIILGMGALSTLRADSPLSHYGVLPLIMSIGAGIVYASTYFPVLAPLPITENAHALAFFAYLRSFAAVWGITIGTAVLQNELGKRLPADILQELPGGIAAVYSVIPLINSLPDDLKSPLRVAFAGSAAVIWEVMAGIAGIGFLASLFMEALPLHTQVDEKWGLQSGSAESIPVVPNANL